MPHLRSSGLSLDTKFVPKPSIIDKNQKKILSHIFLLNFIPLTEKGCRLQDFDISLRVVMAPTTRRRSRSRSDATELSKTSGTPNRRGKRDRAESGGELSIMSTVSSNTGAEQAAENKEVNDSKEDMEVENEQTQPEPLKKPEPVMDVIVHRIRCLKYHPKGIVSMKAVPAWCEQGFIALSRENGYVELKSMNEKLRTVAMISGFRGRPVTSMAWVRASSKDNTPILIGASRDGSLFVVDFSRKSFTGSMTSGGGGIFALESLSTVPGCESFVVAGCEDGSVRIFQHHENGTFLLVSSIPSSGAPVLSLTCQTRNVTGDGLDGMSIFAGIADGTIRRYDCSRKDQKYTWKSSYRMTMESRGRNIPTRIWALKALQDGTLVSANSLGQVQFWDGETGSLEQSVEQTETKADVLDLAISADESKVFASGVDSRVVCIERQLDAENASWILTQARRPHTHDVKSLEICRKRLNKESSEGGLKDLEILVSGGVDTKLSTFCVPNYHKERPRVIYPWPTFSPVFVAEKARLVGIMREDRVDLYRISKKQEISEPLLVPENEMLLGTVKVKHLSNLAIASISSDGQYLVIVNMASYYLFSLSFDKKDRLQTKHISLEVDTKSTISTAKFVTDKTLVLSCVDGTVHIKSLANDPDQLGDKIQPIKNPPITPDVFSVHSIKASPSGTFFATLRNSFQGGVVDIYKNDGEGSRHIWTLPPMETAIADIAFLDEMRLAVASIDFSLFVFDVNEQRLNKWNQDAGTSASFPSDLKFRRDFPVRILSHASNPDKVLMVSSQEIDLRISKDVIPARCYNLCAGLSSLQKEKSLSSPVKATSSFGGIVRGNMILTVFESYFCRVHLDLSLCSI